MDWSGGLEIVESHLVRPERVVRLECIDVCKIEVERGLNLGMSFTVERVGSADNGHQCRQRGQYKDAQERDRHRIRWGRFQPILWLLLTETTNDQAHTRIECPNDDMCLIGRVRARTTNGRDEVTSPWYHSSRKQTRKRSRELRGLLE